MGHIYYMYMVSDRNGVEYTTLKWFEDGLYEKSRCIGKPTSEWVEEELEVLNDFHEQGGILQSKKEAIVSQSNPNQLPTDRMN